MADGDGRSVLNLAEDVLALRTASGKAASTATNSSPSCSAARRSTTRTRDGPLRPDQRSAQGGARLRSRRRALLALPHDRRWRSPAVPRAPPGAHGGRGHRPCRSAGAGAGATPPRTPTISWEAPRANWRWRNASSISLPRRNRTRATWPTVRHAHAKESGSLPPPKHILNAPTKLMREEGYGAGYVYDHSTEEGVSGQNYFPEGQERQQFYRPRARGYERDIEARLKGWAEVRRSAGNRGEKQD